MAEMVADLSLDTKWFADGIRVLGMVAKI